MNQTERMFLYGFVGLFGGIIVSQGIYSLLPNILGSINKFVFTLIIALACCLLGVVLAGTK